jgi:NDP-sugar pyrophosphorylase family protein
MIPILGKPFLQHQMELLRAAGVRDVIICAGYLADKIMSCFGDGRELGLNLAYSVEDRPLGTAGALRNATSLLADDFLVMYGDAYLILDLSHVALTFHQTGTMGLMVVLRNEDRYELSNTTVTDGRVVAYDKRVHSSQMVHIDFGVSALRRTTLELLPEHEPCDLGELFRMLISRNELAAYETRQRFYEIGSPTGLREFTQFLQRKQDSQ